MASKHAACKSHVLLGCGDKVCVVPSTNGDRKGLMGEARIRMLERFHAYIHKVQAKHHAAEKRRPRGDGLIEGRIGGRLTAKQVVREYERARASGNNDKIDGWGLGYNLAQTQPGQRDYTHYGVKVKGKPYDFPIKSKFVGQRRRIKAGYRPRRKAVAA